MNSPELTVKKFTEGLFEFAKGKFKCKEDLERVIEISFRFDKLKNFEELVFHAKYINGLLRIIRNKDNSLEDEYFVNVKKEYAEHIEKVKGQFLLILQPASEFITEILKKKYLEMTVESLENLNKFCDDFSKVKSYLNELKEGGKGF